MQLKSGKDLLGLWQRYKLLHSQCVAAVHKQEDCVDRLLNSASDREITEEENDAWIKDCNVSMSKVTHAVKLIKGTFGASLLALKLAAHY